MDQNVREEVRSLHRSVVQLAGLTEHVAQTATRQQYMGVVALSAGACCFAVIALHAALVEPDWQPLVLIVLFAATGVLFALIPFYMRAARRVADMELRYRAVMHDLRRQGVLPPMEPALPRRQRLTPAPRAPA